VVVCGLVTLFMNSRIGMVNKVIELFGGTAANWLGRTGAFKHIYVWSDVWQHLGFNSVIFISALAGVSSELHEAAVVDGASLLQRIFHVDIPGIAPTFIIMLILRVGSLMNIGYEKVLMLQNDLNRGASEIISTYTYKIALQSQVPQYSYAAAIGLFTSLVNLILLFGVNRATKSLSGSSLW
jgi:ABC-type polysaccharide transport system permease subunit